MQPKQKYLKEKHLTGLVEYLDLYFSNYEKN